MQISDEAQSFRVMHAARTQLLRDELGALRSDLQKHGLSFGDSLGEIRNADQRICYRSAIPLLLDHLQRPYFDDAVGVIAWLLCEKIPEVRAAWPILVKMYKSRSEGRGVAIRGDNTEWPFHAKDLLANALLAAFTPKRIPELVELLRDRTNGQTRVILMQALRRRKDTEIDAVLNELIEDPDLRMELSSWKRFK